MKLVLETSKEAAKKMERDAANLKKKMENQVPRPIDSAVSK